MMTENKRFTYKVTDTDLWYIETITDNFKMNTFDDVKTVTELLNKFSEENKELKQKIESLKMEIAELRESEKDNYNITDGLW